MTRHHIVGASARTTHWGIFDAALPPVLEIASGDRVTLHCLSGRPGVLPSGDFALRAEYEDVHRNLPPAPVGHIMTGPVAVRGARPGDMLEVRILEIGLRQDWGWTTLDPLEGALPDAVDAHRLVHLPLDASRMVATLPWGATLPLRPFFGVLGVAPPPSWGCISSVVPRRHGGNLDITALTAGSTLYLPVLNDGALFSAGDGHAAQGDGEVCGTAIETALSGTFELVLHRDPPPLPLPHGETPEHYLTIGLDPDLDLAARQAVDDMVRLAGCRAGLPAADAYMLCSLAGDLRVSQVVNGHKGVHMLLPKAALHGC